MMRSLVKLLLDSLGLIGAGGNFYPKEGPQVVVVPFLLIE